MNSQPRLLSVIIVVKNDRGIASTLDHIHELRSDVPNEVIVIDASEPTVLADIKKAHPWVKWDQFPVSNRRTTPEQRNRGVALAKGDVIVFIDANCIPAPDWFTGIVESLREGKDIVCGPVEDLNKRNLVHYAEAHKEGRYVDVCTTINVALRREVFDRIGNFDTSFSFGQDIDFFWRAKDVGYQIYYNPMVAIGHDWGEPKEQFGRAFNYGKARAHLYKKHWRKHYKELMHEPHVWAYPLFLLGLPLTIIFPFYPLFLLIPVIKNYRNPVGIILHHVAYGLGVIVGIFKVWPKNEGTQKDSAK